ncbi:hypothetical protein, partial [Alcanivorax sp. HI0044]|uniref:hypothetical protein n=1 Tax=Alcanivorax sp. HI0044 TaxID=1822234 RepID=UPI000A45BAAF
APGYCYTAVKAKERKRLGFQRFILCILGQCKQLDYLAPVEGVTESEWLGKNGANWPRPVT